MWDWTDPEEWEDPLSAEVIIAWLAELGVVGFNEEEMAFSVLASPSVVLRTIPRGAFTCGGEELRLFTPGGEMFVWIEDWLSGCIPKWMEYDTQEARDYIESAVAEKAKRLQSELGAEWRLGFVQVGAESRASRLVFLKKF